MHRSPHHYIELGPRSARCSELASVVSSSRAPPPDSSHCRANILASCWTWATSCYLMSYEIRFLSAPLSALTGRRVLCVLPDSEVKGTKHLARYQSFISHHSLEHIWAKGGMTCDWRCYRSVYCSIQETLCTVKNNLYLSSPAAAGRTLNDYHHLVWDNQMVSRAVEAQAFPLWAEFLI